MNNVKSFSSGDTFALRKNPRGMTEREGGEQVACSINENDHSDEGSIKASGK